MKKKDAPQAPKLESPAASAIIQTLVLRPAKIETTDIDVWKKAVNGFKTGNRTKYYDLCENILADPYLSDAIEKRVNAITNAEITFQMDGKNVEEIDDLIDTPEFEELIREIALSKAFGKSVIEMAFLPEFSVFSYPRKHIKITNVDKPLAERRKYIVAKESDLTGYDYTLDDFIIEAGKDDDLGYVFKAAPYVIYKRGNFGDWAQFAELFGMPFVTGKYSSYDTNTRDQLFEALSTLGGNRVAAVPKESEIEVHENKSSGSSDLYATFRKACNEEILIAVLGNVMTTVDGSSKSQAEVHENGQKDITKSDRRFIQRILNRKIVPLLIKRGYNVAGGFFTFPDGGERISTKERVDMALSLKKQGIAVSDDYFYEITGIPKSEKKDPDPSGGTDAKPPTTKEAGKDKTVAVDKTKDEIKNDDHGFFVKLLERFFGYAPTLRSGAYQNWSGRSTSSTTITLADDYTINIDQLVNQAIRDIYGGKADELINAKLFQATNVPLQHAVNTSLAPIKEDHSDFVKQFKTNTAVFAAFKNHQQTKEMAAMMIDENGKLRPFYKFKKMALELSAKYNIEWLQTEYNTAVKAARMAANLKKFKQSAHLYPNLEYIESVSVHQRALHLTWVGTILPIDHEWWNEHMPPSDWNCSCGVRQTDKKPTEVPEGDANPAFRNNAEKTAEFVNIKQTPYYQHTEEAVRKDVVASAMTMLRAAEKTQLKTEVYKGKKGGSLEIVKQNKNEFKKNVETYKQLADLGGKYSLLPETSGVKNPDAFNHKTGMFSDAKHPITKSGSHAIQNSVKSASRQHAEEVVIRLEGAYTSTELYEGLKAALQANRGTIIKSIVLIRKGMGPITLDAAKLRTRFGNK